MIPMKHTILKITAAFTALLMLFSGCGSNSASSAAADSGAASAAASTADTSSDGAFRTLDEIKESGKIIIGVFSDKAPFGYVDENGAYQGYDVYFAERIGKDLGVDVEYVSLDPASRVEFVQTGKVDVVLANFTVTDERAQ